MYYYFTTVAEFDRLSIGNSAGRVRLPCRESSSSAGRYPQTGGHIRPEWNNPERIIPLPFWPADKGRRCGSWATIGCCAGTLWTAPCTWDTPTWSGTNQLDTGSSRRGRSADATCSRADSGKWRTGRRRTCAGNKIAPCPPEIRRFSGKWWPERPRKWWCKFRRWNRRWWGPSWSLLTTTFMR